MKKVPVVNPGDVFSRKLPDGSYIAVRVLRTAGKSSLLSTSQYVGHRLPSLNDPLLRKTVVQKRFVYKREPAKKWIDGTPPKSFKFLGNVPPTKAEAKAKCNVYAGKWSESTGNEAFLEWRWLHDRAAFEEEVRKEEERSERRRRAPQKPKKMMSEEDFWSIIDLLDWRHQGNDDKVLAPAIQALAAKSKADICRFEERLAFLLY